MPRTRSRISASARRACVAGAGRPASSLPPGRCRCGPRPCPGRSPGRRGAAGPRRAGRARCAAVRSPPAPGRPTGFPAAAPRPGAAHRWDRRTGAPRRPHGAGSSRPARRRPRPGRGRGRRAPRRSPSPPRRRGPRRGTRWTPSDRRPAKQERRRHETDGRDPQADDDRELEDREREQHEDVDDVAPAVRVEELGLGPPAEPGAVRLRGGPSNGRYACGSSGRRSTIVIRQRSTRAKTPGRARCRGRRSGSRRAR